MRPSSQPFMPWSSGHLKDITNDHPVGDEVHSRFLHEQRQLYRAKLKNWWQCSIMGLLNSRLFSHSENWHKENHVVWIYICTHNHENYKKWKGLQKSPDPTPCLQAYHSEISEERWLSGLFLEIAIARDYKAPLLACFQKELKIVFDCTLSLYYTAIQQEIH